MKRSTTWRVSTLALAFPWRNTHGWFTTVSIRSGVAFAPSAETAVACSSSSCLWTAHGVTATRRKELWRRGRGGTVRMQVWSNPQAVQDYKDLLGGQAPEEKTDGPSVIVGKGKLGTALADMGMGDDVMIGRGEGIPESIPGAGGEGDNNQGMLKEFPIYVCVPENEVASVIDSCPPQKREDLVFLQSGCLETLLKSRGLCRNEQTQATLYLSVEKVGAKPKEYLTTIGTDTRGEAKLAAESAVCGKWRGALATRLERSVYNLHCAKVYYLDWRRVMFEKLIFECVINLVGALHKSQNVGFITRFHAEEVADMLFELKNTLRGTLAVTLMNGYPERLLAYGDEVGDDRNTGMDEFKFKWFNQYFYDISKMGLQKGFGDPCPMHTEYLEYGRDQGLFNFKI